MPFDRDIDKLIPLYVDYFHAVTLSEPKNIFTDNVGIVNITPKLNYDAYDVVNTIIRPLSQNGLLKKDGTRLLVPLQGYLVVPDPVGITRFPLVMIGHGNHTADFKITDKKPADHPPPNGSLTFELLPDPVLSYNGYRALQLELASNGIASYSINLNLVNDLDNNETMPFESAALDFSQRILLFFLHLKLLRVLAGESITVPPAGDPFPIKFLAGATFENLTATLANATVDPRIAPVRNAVLGRIDFNRLGFMGHSRGADAVSRVPSYFFNGATLPDPSYPHHDEVNRRIKALSEQIGRPQRDVIKCVLALEPTAVVNQADPDNHGYIIDNSQTMFFLGVGTHDEDVSLDAVRMYEYPSCPKAMIAINGASHKRFNTIWAGHESVNDFGTALIKLNLISKPKHQSILTRVFGSCFTGTLGGRPSHLLRFTKKNNFVVNVPKFVDFQGAWKFGFPFPAPASTITALDAKLTAPPLEALQGSSYKFEQDIKAFFVEKINEGTFTINIPIDPNTSENVSNYNHFSFRFARGVDLSSDAGRVEEKNFTIQFFDNNTPLGKPIAGASITTLELRALQAFDEIKKAGETKDFEYSILLQTAEINLSAHLSAAEMPRVTRIDINVIPDATKSPPTSTAKLLFGTIGGAVLGGLIGLGGAALWNLKDDPDESTGRKYLMAGGTIGAVGLGLIAWKLLKSDKNAFVFKDFLLTNRQIPVPTP